MLKAPENIGVFFFYRLEALDKPCVALVAVKKTVCSSHATLKKNHQALQKEDLNYYFSYLGAASLGLLGKVSRKLGQENLGHQTQHKLVGL